MKTIIKYELVINEALRSALNYHTPDEQINEFIRFFGRHIGSDRIYIFEDCKERHGTDNTYEWCAQGVTPEIDRLQNVDMDVIKWWYDTFSKGESIIITDIEDIKEEHRVSYDMLKAQNVRNVVVCPLRYKDEISVFFGVDNPPRSDYKGLTSFLDMIGTLLISFLKMRNSFIKSNKEAKLSSYSSLSKIYASMHLVDVQTKRYHIIKMTDQIAEYLGKDFKMGEYEIRDDFCGHIKNIAEKMCTESQLQESLEFVDISTLEERLLGENSITHEFTDKISGWGRSRFIPVDYDENGRLLHVLFCIECIEEEKKRENRLIYLAQTDLMTGLCNRGSGEKKITEFLKEKTGGLLCLIDCDKFKSINDTYGHLAGDYVLKRMVALTKSVISSKDIIVRMGGDEFLIILPDSSQTSAEQVAREIKRKLRTEECLQDAKGRHTGISIGIAHTTHFHSSDECIQKMLKEADLNMYTDKKSLF